MKEQIQATHSPDGREFDIKLLLYVIEDILHHATSPSFPGLGLAEATLPQVDVLNDSTVLSGISDMVELLAQPINVTLIEISYKCSWGLDSHTITLALFNILSSFSWDAKVVIALAAFPIYYGRFWLVLGSNALASSMVLLTQLTQLPDMIKRTDSLKPKFEAITNLIKVMLDVTKCIVDFMELPSQYVVLNPPEMVAATASISIAVYWTLRSIVACALQLKYFNGMRLETTTWDEVEERKFKSIQVSMPWFSVHHPSLLDPTAIKYIKEVWHFNKKPLLVIEDGKYICLYGGGNLDWVRRFTNMTRVVAEAASIPLEMMCVGKNNPRKKVWKISNIILAEKLSHILPDPTLIWFFWVRLESMWHSKMQHGKTIENDPIRNEIMTILSFDGSDKGWAVISRGKSEMAKAKGDSILKRLAQFDQWKDHIGEVGFVNALNDNLNKLLTPQHCNHLIFSCTAKNIPETVVCATCKRHMEKFTMYRCCRD
ncbi:hypothetical protein HYC85_021201 [Camellia sinensis]|uniref:Sieve element occlusion N-terminal domain-containing protein n=1 Tax=Camellia sinensis TaxID=4442 RepID=A0A7J7GKR6_CAMSI|nr:hypothetical protein HYC85_021201 [Camellia sinensis]